MKLLRSPQSIEIVIALAVVLCFIAIGVLDYHVRKTAAQRYDTMSSYDFQSGGYRAWYDLLRREGAHVDRFQMRPAFLTDAVGTLIVANNINDAIARSAIDAPSSTYAPADIDALRKWVSAGGRLVWLVDAASGDATASINVEQLTPGTSDASLEVPSVASKGSQRDDAIAIAAVPLTNGVHALSGKSSLRIPFSGNFAVTPLVADNRGTVVGEYPLGKGSVVIVTDESLFQNSRIAKADNARLAYNLAVQGLSQHEAVAFEEWTHGYQAGDTWWSILPQPFKVAFSIICLAALLMLAGAVWRFGPTARLAENTERTSQEYVVSMAALLQRGNATRKAVRDLAEIGLHRAARSMGLPDATPASKIAARIRGTQSGDQRADDIVALERLAGYEHPTGAELVLAARLSHSLRKEFGSDGFDRIEPRRTASGRSA